MGTKSSLGCACGLLLLLLVIGGAIAGTWLAASFVGGGLFVYLVGFIGVVIVGLFVVFILFPWYVLETYEEEAPSKRVDRLQNAARLKPDDLGILLSLGEALADAGRRNEADEVYQKALHVRTDDPKFYLRLGDALKNSRPEKAIQAYQEALRLNKELPNAHFDLGLLFRETGQLDDAIAAFREVHRLQKNYFRAHDNPHDNLGLALRDTGRFDEAIAEFREADRISALKGNSNPRRVAALRETELMARVVDRLPAVLEGRDRPVDAAECLVFAQLCQLPFVKQYAAAGRLFDEAFTKKPELAEDLEKQYRFNAARFAARAGCGRSGDAAGLNETERAGLRRQALDWLQADLKAWGDLLRINQDDINTLNRISLAMQEWLRNRDLAGVRAPEALAKLPEAERQAWQELWHRVEATLGRIFSR